MTDSVSMNAAMTTMALPARSRIFLSTQDRHDAYNKPSVIHCTRAEKFKLRHYPRFTYVTHGVPEEVRMAYERAMLVSLSRCTPLEFSPELGAAFACQPYYLRFIEYRSRQ
jgi:hypothetical protein